MAAAFRFAKGVPVFRDASGAARGGATACVGVDLSLGGGEDQGDCKGQGPGCWSRAATQSPERMTTRCMG